MPCLQPYSTVHKEQQKVHTSLEQCTAAGQRHDRVVGVARWGRGALITGGARKQWLIRTGIRCSMSVDVVRVRAV